MTNEVAILLNADISFWFLMVVIVEVFREVVVRIVCEVFSIDACAVYVI